MGTDSEILGLANLGIYELMQLEEHPTVGKFTDAIKKLVGAYGFQDVAYFCPTFSGRSRDNPFLVYTTPQEWEDHYRKSNYDQIDPVVITGARSLLPVDWARLDRSNRKVNKLFNESREAGVGSQGLTIPLRGAENGVWALFTVTSNDSDYEWSRRRREIIADMVLVGHFMHQKAYELHSAGEDIDLNAISRRETEALSWTAEGKSVADISELMHISMETVKAHLDSARFKLGALNRVHAVVKALRHGLIR